MSGLIRGVKKVFKKVGKFVKKVALPALAIGAVVFTAGAALGIGGMAGGWGAAVTKGLGAIGLNSGGAVGSILTGALTKAGTYGAVAGLGSMAMGGSFSKGAAVGGLAGAAVGGIGAALGGAGAAAAAPAAAAPAVGAPAVAVPGVVAPAAGAAGAAPMAAAPAAAAAPTTGIGGALARFGESGLGKILSTPAAGTAISGLGQGLASGMAAKDEAEAAAAEQQRLTDSYEGVSDAMTLDDPGSVGPQRTVRYERRNEKPRPTPRYVWNQQTGTIDRV